MSKVYFHSPSGTVSVPGSDRAYLSSLIDSLSRGFLDAVPYRHLAGTLPAGAYPLRYVQDEGRFRENLWLWLCHGDGRLSVAGREVDPWVLRLNTAAVVGSPAVKLAARIHAQCEVHCYVLGRNRQWLAHLIRSGRPHVFRDAAWDALCSFLGDSHVEPVVLSYSVCRQFPNAELCGFVPSQGDDSDDWLAPYEAMTAEERWQAGMAVLMQKPLMEVTPEDFEGYRFGDRLDLFWLYDECRRAHGA